MSNMALPTPPPPSTQQSVAAEIEAELAGQLGPLESEAAALATQEQRAVQDLNALFGDLLPFVQGSAERVASSYQAGQNAQESIFNQAWTRLNSLRSERAGEAQALAQQIGAPIPLDMFTKSVDLERSVFVPEAAGELLKSSAIAQAGTQEAEAFAGRVFPLKRARLEQETRNFYRDQITDLKRQIATIKGMKKGMINERLRQRLLEDYEMRLARQQEAFNQWSQRKQLAQAQRGLSLEERRLNEEIRANQAGEGLQQQQLNLTKKQQQLGQQTYVNNQKQNIIEVTNALADGGVNSVDRKMAEWRYVDAITGAEIPPGTAGGKWTLEKWTQTVDTKVDPVRNPTRLLNLLMARLGIRKGQTNLYNFAVGQVIQVLKTKGVTGIPNDPAKWPGWWKKYQAAHKPPVVGQGPGYLGGPGPGR